MNYIIIKRGFIAAGLINVVGVLVFSRVFTNEVLNEADPVVMSNFGLLIIAIWGLAYIAVARNIKYVRSLAAVFAIEKFVYTAVWLLWMKNHSSTLGEIFKKDFLVGIFYSIYGINDAIFMLFFAWVFFRLRIPTKNR